MHRFFLASSAAAALAVLVLSLFGSRFGGARGPESGGHAAAFPPTPPRQSAPWTPPPQTTLPPAFVSAAQTLFAQNALADPRGGAYHAITVRVGNVWRGDGGLVETHGWVLPEPGTGGQRFAVAWSGLTYLVARVGDPADLSADVRALVAADEAQRARHAAQFPKFSFYRMQDARPEALFVSHKSLLPVKACLLLRLNETALAEQVWDAWLGGVPSNVNSNRRDRADPYLRLATDWAWTTFDRAVCAHMRGEDVLAQGDARALTRVSPQLEAEAQRRGIQRPLAINHGDPPRPYLGFLAPVPELLADSNRRMDKSAAAASAAVAPTADGIVAAHMNDRKARIAALIGALDQVAARQDGQPGGVGLDADPIPRALIAEGEAGVGPLLDAAESDTRLTRAVSFGRDFFYERRLLSVRDAAYVTASRILRLRNFSGGQPTVAGLRAYWNANKDVPLTERWWRALADDTGVPSGWLEAAANIVERSDIEYTGMWVSAPQCGPGLLPAPPMRGEALRARTNPSVSDLLARRVAAIAAAETNLPIGPNASFRAGDGIALGLMLAEWDALAAVPTLRLLTNRARVAFDAGHVASGDYDGLAGRIARLTVARLRAGDTTATTNYAAWLRSVAPTRFTFRATASLEPLWRYPDEPTLSRAAERLFNGANSPWNPLVPAETPPNRSTHAQEQAVGSPLLAVRAFRRQVLRELSDTRPAGILTMDANRNIQVTRRESGGSSGEGSTNFGPIATGDLLGPRPGAFLPLRLCDLYAAQVAEVARRAVAGRPNTFLGMPRFALYWPERERDAAIQRIHAYLERFGDRFVAVGDNQPLFSRGDFPFAGVSLSLPARNRPATTADVAVGRALFTLENVGTERRVAPLPAPAPVWARRRAKNSATQTDFDTEGAVWQAEEARVNGRWTRFYGWVGRHAIARVPADEIVFARPGGKPLAPKANGYTTGD